VARVNEGSHSFTCHPHADPQVESAFSPPPQIMAALLAGTHSQLERNRQINSTSNSKCRSEDFFWLKQ